MMMEQMTSSEWNETYNYYNTEPFGEYREELRHGQRMAQFTNFHQRDPKTTPNPYPPIDFMNFTPRVAVKAVDLSDEETQAQIDRDIFGV